MHDRWSAYLPAPMVPRSPLPRALRHARGLFSLGLVGVLAVPLIATTSAVEVSVDGQAVDHRTYAGTVGEVLEELDVEVEPADEVSPAKDTELSSGLEIEIARAVEVDVVVDGELVETVHEPVVSVAGALEAADLDTVREDGAEITPAWTAPVEDGDVVEVALPTEVALTVDDETHELHTHVGTVEELLLDEAVDLGDDDVVSPGLDEELADELEVVVERVDFDEVVEEVVLEHDEERRETDELDEGTTRVEQEGADGLRHDTYRVELVDGEEVDRELLDREVVEEPEDRIVLVGTRAPEPEPEPSSSSSSSSSSGGGSVSGDVWDRLAQCEAGGNWSHSGGTFHGGLQFHPDTWNRHKPSGYPQYAYQASRSQQIAVAERVLASQGWAAWPACSSRLGLR